MVPVLGVFSMMFIAAVAASRSSGLVPIGGALPGSVPCVAASRKLPTMFWFSRRLQISGPCGSEFGSGLTAWRNCALFGPSDSRYLAQGVCSRS